MEKTIPSHYDEIEIPNSVLSKWQKILDLLCEFAQVPVALIMKVKTPRIEVFAASRTKDNPYKKGASDELPGLYCETVMKTDKKLLVKNALEDEKWKNNPDIKLGMISYLGYPLKWSDGKFFGTICILDKKENAYNKKVNDLISAFKELVEFHLDLIQKSHIQKCKIENIEKINKFAVGRELKMVELKNKIKDLEKKLSEKR